jgi:hypothetical protein
LRVRTQVRVALFLHDVGKVHHLCREALDLARRLDGLLARGLDSLA